MQMKTWQEHRTEMQQENRQEWLQVVSVSLGVIAAGAVLAYLVQ